jgi:hypothetical protein
VASFDLPRLRITEGAVVLPGPSGAPTVSWPVGHGGALLHGWREPGCACICVPGLATFRMPLGPLGSGVEAACLLEDPAAWPRASEAFYRSVLPMFLHLAGFEVLHASAVATDQGAVAFAARSGTGKSTAARLLAERGHPRLADDATVWDLGPEGPRLWPLPFRGLPDPPGGDGLGPAWRSESLPLKAVVVLERMDGHSQASFSPERLLPAAAFQALLPHATLVELAPEGRPLATAEATLDLALSVRVLRVRFQPDPDRLGAWADRLEALLLDPAGALS